MVTICGSTLINIGTLSRRWIEAMEKAAKKADALGKRWVLDPVGAGATPLRMQTCTELLKYHPTVIRGNAMISEELRRAAEFAYMSREELLACQEAAVDAAFCGPETKNFLRRALAEFQQS